MFQRMWPINREISDGGGGGRRTSPRINECGHRIITTTPCRGVLINYAINYRVWGPCGYDWLANCSHCTTGFSWSASARTRDIHRSVLPKLAEIYECNHDFRWLIILICKPIISEWERAVINWSVFAWARVLYANQYAAKWIPTVTLPETLSLPRGDYLQWVLNREDKEEK